MTTANETTIKDQVRQFIREELAAAKGIATFTDSESLTESGIIDSLGIFRLVTFLEENFGVRVGDEEISADNLQSVDKIEALVISKSKKK
jgi:methoxymalonate biosynthesis acyl carrier protein